MGVLALKHLLGALDHIGYAEPVKIHSLAAGDYRRRYLVGFGGGQYERYVGRRLLQRFQQGVEGVGSKCVRLVDYVYLVLQLKRHEPRLFDYVAHIVHAGVAGSVQLDYIRALPGAYAAGTAAAARLAVYGLFAVHRPCEYARGACLTGTPGAREKVGMGSCAGLHLVFQYCGYMLLPYHLGECGGPVLPVKGAVAHACLQFDYLYFIL